MTKITKKQAIECLCGRVTDLENKLDLDEQTLSIDGCELTISNGNTVQLPKTVYYYDNITPGVIQNIWNAPAAEPHGNASDIFTEAPRGLGFGDDIFLPGHINGTPTTNGLVGSWTSTTGTISSTDQYEYAGFIYIEEDGTQLRDVNGNTGERFRIWVGECCSNPSIVYERTTDTGSGDTGSGGAFVTLNEGWHFLAFQGSDLTVQAGVQLQTSTNGTTWANFTGETSVTKPKLMCKQEACDYTLLDGESSCVPSCSAAIVASNPGEAPNLNVTKELIEYEKYRGRSATGTTVQHVDNATMTRTAVGQWQVRFTGGTHPNGESYTPHLTAEEQLANRDGVIIQIVQGTQNASGFDVMMITGDNGGAADGFVDSPWSWGVEAPITVVTDVTIV